MSDVDFLSPCRLTTKQLRYPPVSQRNVLLELFKLRRICRIQRCQRWINETLIQITGIWVLASPGKNKARLNFLNLRARRREYPLVNHGPPATPLVKKGNDLSQLKVIIHTTVTSGLIKQNLREEVRVLILGGL